ncbi:GNAT family N-acetyltransferase [Flavobacterium sp. DG1-102-2]|uniref:GNAT family N-acetyltransferase n=1 Tax=Flavobacterium sp. DG1-102-2 TaxID=3081663 RepID=UPI00294A13C3|nr:GNAT family N-acetyltransferase [Flavobacterium sp. DG1-102-2]MDV6168678.1 GNAT family N-acetyltransferase [Flavobacterium sp. DG1-102-2]
MEMIIRKIEQKDNAQVAALIRSVLIEYNVPKVGTAYADAALDCMFETYLADKSAYFVVEDNGTLIGGAGIAPLENGPEDVAELQKMYFLPQARGTGMGSKMMDTCLAFAKAEGFERCYLETMPYMEAAQKLYRKSGFNYLDAPMGNTGHNSCPV